MKVFPSEEVKFKILSLRARQKKNSTISVFTDLIILVLRTQIIRFNYLNFLTISLIIEFSLKFKFKQM